MFLLGYSLGTSLKWTLRSLIVYYIYSAIYTVVFYPFVANGVVFAMTKSLNLNGIDFFFFFSVYELSAIENSLNLIPCFLLIYFNDEVLLIVIGYIELYTVSHCLILGLGI